MTTNDSLINQILNISEALLKGDYSKRITSDFDDTTLNKVVQNLNALADKLQTEKPVISGLGSGDQVVNTFVEVISSFANHDFEKKLLVSEDGTLLDAIAAGINMLGDELQNTTVSQEELRDERNRLDEAQATAKIGSWEFDLQTRNVFWSKETFKIFGLPLTPPSELLDVYLKKIHPDDSAIVQESMRNAIRFGSDLSFENRIICTNGMVRYLYNIFKTLTDSNGRVTHLIGTVQDITERKKIERELIQAKEEAEAANKTKSQFLANVSHELRTPLNGVIGFTDLLNKTSVNEVQQKYLGIVTQSASTLLNLIDDILDFSKLDAGKLQLNKDSIALTKLSQQVANMVKYQADKKGLTTVLVIPHDIPKSVIADEIRLKQILTNLLSNAVKFTEYGEVELSLEKLSNTPAEVVVRFMVKDTGIGIEPANQKKIFEAFVQEDISTTKKFGGTGLGLTISNKLLALMGSELHLKSEPGSGSTFYFDVTFKIETV